MVCELQQWEAAECPKLGSTFKKIIIKVGEIDHLLMEWLREPNLSHEQRLRIIGLVNAVNEIPPMLGDLGFPYPSREQSMNGPGFRPLAAPPDIDPQLAWEILMAVDIQAEYERIGFRPLPGAVPDQNGWLEGEAMYAKGGRGFINVGTGPERGLYTEHLPGGLQPGRRPPDVH